MTHLLDTNVAIGLRDSDPVTRERVRRVVVRAAMSIITHVELEGGVYKVPALTPVRRAAVDALVRRMTVLPFTADELSAYRQIVASVGHSRPKVIDRMIAATALVHDLTLVTMNGRDFRDVPGLKLEIWDAPIEL